MTQYLYSFRLPNGTEVATRAPNAAIARTGMRMMGVYEFVELNCSDATAAFQYSISHPFDWTNQSPLWLNDKRARIPADHQFKYRFFHKEICNV